MRGDDRDDTTRSQDETPAVRLLNGICRLCLDLGRIPIHQRVLSHAAARDPVEKFLTLRE